MDFSKLRKDVAYEIKQQRQANKEAKADDVSFPLMFMHTENSCAASLTWTPSAKDMAADATATELPFEIMKHGEWKDEVKAVDPAFDESKYARSESEEDQFFFMEWPVKGLNRSLKIKQSLELGHGGTVWDSSLVLSRYMETFSPSYWSRKRVLELGSGTGLVGLTVAALGAEQVRLTDLPELQSLLEDNVKLNSWATRNCTVNVTPFRWGSTEAPRVMLTSRKSWKERRDSFLKRLSIRGDVAHEEEKKASHDQNSNCYDVVLGSDLTYDPENFDSFIQVLSEVCGPHTVVFLAHEWRNKNDEAVLFRLLLEAGFFCNKVNKEDLDPDYSSPEITIFEIRKLEL